MFPLRLLRLLVSVALEGLVNGLRIGLFPFQRCRQRERIRAIMCRPRILSAVLLLSSLALAGGCTTFPGSSFDHQLDELYWSTTVLVEEPRWPEELWYDVQLVVEPEWAHLGDSLTGLGW